MLVHPPACNISRSAYTCTYIRSPPVGAYIHTYVYALTLTGPSSHVILNALNLKAFICNRIITAGAVIRFAVSPKRIYPSQDCRSRERPSGVAGFRILSAAAARILSILIAVEGERNRERKTSQIQRRDYGDDVGSILIVRDIVPLLVPRPRYSFTLRRDLAP